MLTNPEEESTFLRCKLDFSDRQKNRGIYLLHQELIALRHRDPLLGQAASGTFDGAVLSDRAFLLRFFGKDQDDRLLIVNLGTGQQFDPAPEPLLAPPSDRRWELVFSSEDPRFGGSGSPPLESEGGYWIIPAHAAALLAPKPIDTTHEK